MGVVKLLREWLENSFRSPGSPLLISQKYFDFDLGGMSIVAIGSIFNFVEITRILRSKYLTTL